MRTTITNRMMIGASLLMMTFSLCLTDANAQTCAKVPTCEELGYTKTSCPNGNALKCPFDQTKLFCGGECQAGDIYYSDNTCSSTYSSNKTVVGVVAREGVIVHIALTSEDMTWDQAVVACKSVTIGGKTAHLPTLDEGRVIMNNSGAINSGLSKIPGATKITDDNHWSSTEYDYDGLLYASAAMVFPPAGSGSAVDDKTHQSQVRCVFGY